MKFGNRKIDLSGALPSLISIALGMLIGIIILFIVNPSNGLEGMLRLFKGPFNYGVQKGLGNMLYYATPILLTGLSVGFAFKTGLFNIGGAGQFIVGAFIAVTIAHKFTFIPSEILWLVALLGAAIAGAIWAALIGVLKAYRNVNPVITGIMMNYIGMYVVNYLIKAWDMHDLLRNRTKMVNSFVPKLGLDKIFPESYADIGFLIAVGIAILLWIILNKTTFGYELTAVGLNRHASQYAGINENRSIIISILIAGALAGLGGGLAYLADTGRSINVVNVLAPEGFDGIAIALLGLSHPIGIIGSGLFITYLKLAGQAMQGIGYVPEIISMMTGIILYISALSLLFTNFLGKRRARSKIIESEALHE